jgi:hypothetical protein
MDAADTEARVEGFIVRFSEEIAAEIRGARAIMRARLPGALELVYDNYNALAIGYGPTERPSDIIFSIAAYPRWISLFLVGGPSLDDPTRLLKGEGARVRHLVLDTAARLHDPDVVALMEQGLAKARIKLDPAQGSRTIVKSVSARQRPRRRA